MDQAAISTFFGVYTLLFASFCWISTFLIRRVVETTWPSLKKASDVNDLTKLTYLTPMSRWWNEVILYILPVNIGIVGALAAKTILPAGFQLWQSRVVFGCVIGFMSGFLYKLFIRIIRGVAAKVAGVDIGAGSVPPPPGD